LRASILDELDGSLQESVALGLISPNTYSNLAQEVGLDESATQSLLAGESLSDITKRRLQEEQDQSNLPTTAIQGIGESRAQSLTAADIDTVGELAAADPEPVADITQVTVDTAETWIQIASEVVE